MKKSLLLVFLLSCFTKIAFGQNATLSGIVKDIKSKMPLPYVNIVLKNAKDSVFVSGTVSDEEGHFSLPNIKSNAYILQLSYIGYQTKMSAIEVNPSSISSDVGFFEMAENAQMLNEAVVTYRKKLIEKTNEGFILNASANISQVGGTATDLLKSTPTVAVDADGVITLRGKTPLILINGRNSKLAKADQIPASSIESIEIINNASAKYDANAQSGIINIRLKKNAQIGTNGAVALGTGFGSRGRVSSSALLNHKTEKWNFGVGYDNRFAGRTKQILGDRTNFNLTDNYLLIQERNDERIERLQNLKFNLDFQPNEKNSFSLEAIGSTEGQDNDESLNSLIRKKNNAFNAENDRHSLEYERSKVGEFALNYERKFTNPKKTLSANLSTSLEQGRENTDITTQNLNENGTTIGNLLLEKTHSYSDENVSNAMLDYAFPIFEKGEIETGYKGTFRSLNNDYQAAEKVGNDYIINAGSSNIFKFKEQIHAFYALFHAFSGTEEKPKWKYIKSSLQLLRFRILWRRNMIASATMIYFLTLIV